MSFSSVLPYGRAILSWARRFGHVPLFSGFALSGGEQSLCFIFCSCKRLLRGIHGWLGFGIGLLPLGAAFYLLRPRGDIMALAPHPMPLFFQLIKLFFGYAAFHWSNAGVPLI